MSAIEAGWLFHKDTGWAFRPTDLINHVDGDPVEHCAGADYVQGVARRPAMTILQAFIFLDAVRTSGQINMWGASVALEQAGLSRADAKKFHRLWMQTFDGESTVAQRAARAAMK